MSKEYSIAAAPATLAAMVQEVETDGLIQFTQHGRTVAVLLSQADYEKLVKKQFDFVAAYDRFRASADFEALDIDPEILMSEMTLWAESSPCDASIFARHTDRLLPLH